MTLLLCAIATLLALILAGVGLAVYLLLLLYAGAYPELERGRTRGWRLPEPVVWTWDKDGRLRGRRTARKPYF